ncbi:hypothetical protein PRIPAC_85180 [Pristionchus pacificus]|uniref:Uncharacterized protein n=1 Tax=Pristionchus pacificus TaxID=54126 RepID=A0A2A6BTT0_PRIPA|nr:hypothetical protein PRIPAC_85180 [Pristionchus pacificus]|eukprot:PDM69298.1 hypothetical protein PRIPAC_47600 [Pristionchus pacificus]
MILPLIFARPESESNRSVYSLAEWSERSDRATVHATGRPFSTICCNYSCAVLGLQFLGGSGIEAVGGVRQSQWQHSVSRFERTRPTTSSHLDTVIGRDKTGLDKRTKEEFYAKASEMVERLNPEDTVVLAGDWNGHVGKAPEIFGDYSVHGGKVPPRAAPTWMKSARYSEEIMVIFISMSSPRYSGDFVDRGDEEIEGDDEIRSGNSDLKKSTI